jgi:hypothetical protein
VVVAAVAGVTVLAVGCGGTRTPSASRPPDRAARDAVAYSTCMRAHGLPDFPDPDSRGGFVIGIHPGSDLSARSPQYRSANNACGRLLLNGGREAPVQEQQDIARFLRYAACMRAHGEPQFPDPTVSGGGVDVILKGSGVDPGSPQFASAQHACRSLAPGG